MANKSWLPLLGLAFSLSFFGAACNPPALGIPESSMPTPATPKKATIEIFTSETCPHCVAVKKEIADKGWDKLLPLAIKPLDGDRTNQQLVMEHAVVCRLPQNNIQVPFLWDGQRCLVGQEQISSYLAGLAEKYETSTSTSR